MSYKIRTYDNRDSVVIWLLLPADARDQLQQEYRSDLQILGEPAASTWGSAYDDQEGTTWRQRVVNLPKFMLEPAEKPAKDQPLKARVRKTKLPDTAAVIAAIKEEVRASFNATPTLPYTEETIDPSRPGSGPDKK